MHEFSLSLHSDFVPSIDDGRRGNRHHDDVATLARDGYEYDRACNRYNIAAVDHPADSQPLLDVAPPTVSLCTEDTRCILVQSG